METACQPTGLLRDQSGGPLRSVQEFSGADLAASQECLVEYFGIGETGGSVLGREKGIARESISSDTDASIPCRLSSASRGSGAVLHDFSHSAGRFGCKRGPSVDPVPQNVSALWPIRDGDSEWEPAPLAMPACVLVK